MTLMDIIPAVREEFPTVSEAQICLNVNELEHRLIHEIFDPAGLEHREHPLRLKQDMNEPLLLGQEYRGLYTSYLFSVFALLECDTERSNAFAALFNRRFSETAIRYRREHPPIADRKITGRNLP